MKDLILLMMPKTLDPYFSHRFSSSGSATNSRYSSTSIDCLALISKATPAAGIHAPTAAARLRISPKFLFISRIGNCGLYPSSSLFGLCTRAVAIPAKTCLHAAQSSIPTPASSQLNMVAPSTRFPTI